MGEAEINGFLSDLAVNKKVSASPQNQALCAVLFLYKQVLNREVGSLGEMIRARKSRRLSVVFTRSEVRRILESLRGAKWLISLYGTGMRLMKCLRLRVKDLDFSYHQIYVRDGKGGKDRVTVLPQNLVEPLQRHLSQVRKLHEKDLDEGYGRVELPYALERKYPKADREWGWQYVFPAPNRSIDPRSGVRRRHHFYPQTLQRAVKEARRKAEIVKPASCHTFRHSFAPLEIISKGNPCVAAMFMQSEALKIRVGIPGIHSTWKRGLQNITTVEIFLQSTGGHGNGFITK